MVIRESVLDIDDLGKRDLSYSDYFSVDVPYEVKPTFGGALGLGEDQRNYGEDYPLRAKDLFKGLHEDILQNGYNYWLDPQGRFNRAKQTFDNVYAHVTWATNYLLAHNIEWNEQRDSVYDVMFGLGFVRVKVIAGEIWFEYAPWDDIGPKPNHKQMSALMDSAIESQMKLMDISGRGGKARQEIEILQENARIIVREKESLHEEKLPDHTWYWLDPKGKLIPMEKVMKTFGKRFMMMPDTYEFAQRFLAINGIESDDNDALDKMYELGYILVFTGGGIINYEYGHHKPNQVQMATLLRDSQDSHFHLVDKKKHQIIRRDDTPLRENKETRHIFIEGMMPDDMDTFKSHLVQLFAYLQKELQLKTVPKVKLLSDEKNADKVLGKTAYYDPDNRTVCLYTTNRHQKDILRSFAHEIIHHWQHENEKLQASIKGEDPVSDKNLQYAQKNPWLRQMEKQAYLLGNICFRDWEDQKKASDRKSQKKMVEKTMLIGKQYPLRRPNYRG